MNHTFYIFRHLARRARFTLLGYALAWAALGVAVWQLPARRGDNDLYAILQGVLMGWSLPLAMGALRHAPAAGTDTFWRTRPPRWQSVWLAQALFLAVFLAGPPLILWVVNGILLDSALWQWGYGLGELLCFIGPLGILPGILSFARGWYSSVLAFMGLALCFVAGIYVCYSTTRFSPVRQDPRSLLAVLQAGPLIILLWSWMMGMRRSALTGRAVWTGLALAVIPPALLSAAMKEGPVQELTIILPETAGEDASLAGLPPRTVALSQWGNLQVTDISGTPAKFLIPYLSMWHDGDVSNRLTPLLPTLKPLFPEPARWYGTFRQPYAFDPLVESPRENQSGKVRAYFLTNPDAGNTTFQITGGIEGDLVTTDIVVRVPLRENERQAKDGTCLRLTKLEIEPLRIALTADVRTAGCLNDIAADRARVPDSPHPRLFMVLHVPAVPMCVFMEPGYDYDRFRSLQCQQITLPATTEMPLAEGIRGTRFTPETLAGAELVLCAPRLVGQFHATTKKELHNLLPPAKGEELEGILQRLALIPSVHGSMVDYSKELLLQDLARLRELGAPAMRAMLARSWGIMGPDRNFNLRSWCKGRLTEEYLPELAAAVEQDYRWMIIAEDVGLSDKLATAALNVVRHRREKLPLSILESAALAALPEDYPALELHVRNANYNGSTGRLLWTRLRQLPGFDWRRAALWKWQDWIYRERAGDFPPFLAAMAALAGGEDALNWLLTRTQPDRGPSPSQPSPAEWRELLALMEGAPAAEPERSAWLRQNKDRFTWDAASGRYRVKQP